MGDEEKMLSQILAKNLQQLLSEDIGKGKIPRLAAKSGVSPRHIANILSEKKSATLTIAAKLARTYDVPVWLLLHPSFDRKSSKKLKTLIDDYLLAKEDGRLNIEVTASLEPAFSSAISQHGSTLSSALAVKEHGQKKDGS